ncbi:MAG: A/G-specific adenine glycosylase, partial [Betaproteobacteria bacterium]|nr:A/G-specific adenine glycosylase [Betaproteobacteria bacterium]
MRNTSSRLRIKKFSSRIINWQRRHGRHGLPWQGADAYSVWLSEIMLQQTTVVTVKPYFHNFLERFPDVASLAAAPVEAVMQQWAGLGYYSRARNLHACAKAVCADHGGLFPASEAELRRLPGVGPY